MANFGSMDATNGREVRRNPKAGHVVGAGDYLLAPVLELAGSVAGKRALDIGCGHGYLVGELARRGASVVGVDTEEFKIDYAREHFPESRFELMSGEPGLIDRLGEEPFDLVVSTEVIEHVFSPAAFVSASVQALTPGGRLIYSTPYHGYLKNLTLAALGKQDQHYEPLMEGGHIKFWSRKSMHQAFVRAGLSNVQFRGAGRRPYLWMSMVMSADKPV
jgi:2-polyprenyl-3-methyl-5-hydroxy-6-metoxy-1,4-benzoquinol methylase